MKSFIFLFILFPSIVIAKSEINNILSDTLAVSSSNILNANKRKQDSLELIKTYRAKGLGIVKWKVYDISEYTDGTGVSVVAYNPTNKVIKYLNFAFIGYNRVDDIISDGLLGKTTIKVQAVGPFNPGDVSEVNFDYVWHTDMVETVKISQIIVQYMDGTIKTISDPDKIIIDSKELKILLGVY